MRMTKVLLVDPSPESAGTLSKRLGEAGYDVVAVANGSAAAGMLESERPDLVLSHADVQDMDGFELFMLVRKDPTTMETPFLLIAGRNRPVALAAQEAGGNLSLLTGDVMLESIVERVNHLLAPDAGSRLDVSFERARGSAEPLWAAFDRAAVAQPEMPSLGGGFAGSLDVIDLAEVTQAMALGRKTGRLEVSLPGGEAAILFENGRVVHAEFDGRKGEEAFAAIISRSQREPHARFRFSRMERPDVLKGPKTISRTVEQVLLDIAVGIDEGGPKAPDLERVAPAPLADS